MTPVCLKNGILMCTIRIGVSMLLFTKATVLSLRTNMRNFPSLTLSPTVVCILETSKTSLWLDVM